MNFTKVQISELMRKHAEKENGLHDLMEIMLESMMVAERGEFLRDNPTNKGNGYRLGHTYGQGKDRSFAFPATVTATSIRRFLPYCATGKRSATDWPEFSTPKGLRRNRSVMCLTGYMVSITPNQASAVWLNASGRR